MKATKFEFYDLTAPLIPLEEQVKVEEKDSLAPKPILYTSEQFTAAEEAAYSRGLMEGELKQKTLEKDFENNVLELLQAINAKLYDIKSEINYEEQQLMGAFAELAITIAESLYKQKIPEEDAATILNFIEEHKEKIISAPKVVFKIPVKVKTYLQPKIDQIFKQHFDEGMLQLEDNTSLSAADCIIELEGATLSSTTKEMKSSIAQMLKKHFVIDEQAILSQDDAIIETTLKEKDESRELSGE